MVGTAGIEPATPAMSTQCSPTELRARHHFRITKGDNRISAAHVSSRYILNFHNCARAGKVYLERKTRALFTWPSYKCNM